MENQQCRLDSKTYRPKWCAAMEISGAHDTFQRRPMAGHEASPLRRNVPSATIAVASCDFVVRIDDVPANDTILCIGPDGMQPVLWPSTPIRWAVVCRTAAMSIESGPSVQCHRNAVRPNKVETIPANVLDTRMQVKWNFRAQWN